MDVAFSNNPVPDVAGRKSVFLVGPTPRDSVTPSWRPEAIGLFNELHFDGVIFVPEWDWSLNGMQPVYDNQIKWEEDALDAADLIMAWVPRELKTMPAFTTNVEFGIYLTSGRLIYGRPDTAPKCGYLDYKYLKVIGETPHNALESLVRASYNKLEG